VTIHRFFHKKRLRAMTLIEVIVALGILALCMGGIMAALLQSRRLTEGSVAQGSAITLVQGYIEQMKNMELLQLIGGKTDKNGNLMLTTTSYSIPTLLDAHTSDPLQTSTGSPPALSSITPGVTPSGVVDNLKHFDISKDLTATSGTDTDADSTATTTQVTWASAWPGARNYPDGTVGATDLKLNLWVWVTDLSDASSLSAKVYGVTIIYTWQFQDGGSTRYHVGTVRTIRSSVPTF